MRTAALLSLAALLWPQIVRGQPDVECRLLAVSTPTPAEEVVSLPPSMSIAAVGEPFYLEAWIRDTFSPATGISSAYLDIGWSGVGDVTANSAEAGLSFPLFVDIGVDTNAVHGLGGTFDPNAPVPAIAPNWAKVGTVELTGTSPGSLVFALGPADVPVAAYGRGIVPAGDIDYGQRTLTLFEGEDIIVELVAQSAPTPYERATMLPTSTDQVTIHQPYVVEVWVSDVGAIKTGVTSAYVDVTWPAALASAEAATVSSNYPLFQSGTIQTGAVVDLGGTFDPNDPEPPGVAPQWAKVATIAMRADALGDVTHESGSATIPIAAFDRGIIPAEFILFGSVTVSVCPDCTITADAQVCAQTGDHVASVLDTPGATYEWSIENGTILGPDDTASITYEAGAPGPLTLSVAVSSPLGCICEDTAEVLVRAAPAVDAGPDQGCVCGDAAIQLAGSASDYDTLQWTAVPGGGTFSPAANVLDPVYTPSQADLDAGSVTLTLTATALPPCDEPAVDMLVVTFDQAPPELDGCPPDATVECDDIPPPAEVTATDTCDGDVEVAFDEVRTDGDCPDAHTLTRTWTATDACGNAAECVQVLTVVDTTAPTFNDVPADATVECDAVPPAPDVTATDNCDPDVSVEFAEDTTPGDCTGSYTVVRTWTATDDCGNTTSATQTLTVVDTTAPTLNDVPADATVECDAVPPAPDVTATDNCDPDVTVELDENITPGACADDYLLTRTWTATDACGNVVEEFQILTVVDMTAPTFTHCPADIVTDGGPNGCTATLELPLATATDNCSTPTISYWVDGSPITTPHTFSAGSTLVQVQAEDACGNVNDTDCSFTVEVHGAFSPADFDADCDVDFDDYEVISGCLAGPDILEPQAGCDPASFAVADLDGDGDVDLVDMSLFQTLFTGP